MLKLKNDSNSILKCNKNCECNNCYLTSLYFNEYKSKSHCIHSCFVDLKDLIIFPNELCISISSIINNWTCDFKCYNIDNKNNNHFCNTCQLIYKFDDNLYRLYDYYFKIYILQKNIKLPLDIIYIISDYIQTYKINYNILYNISKIF